MELWTGFLTLVFENGIQFHRQPHGSFDFQLTHHIGHGWILRAIYNFLEQGARADQRCIGLFILMRYNRRTFGGINKDESFIAEIKFDLGLDWRHERKFLTKAGCDRVYAHGMIISQSFAKIRRKITCDQGIVPLKIYALYFHSAGSGAIKDFGKRIMRMKFILTALATVSLSGLISPAALASQTAFHPVESWKVNDMSGGDNPDNRCVLITEYNNGFYVQFQGTAGKIELLSVNMRQDALEAGSRMDVKITIPGQAAVNLQAQAFNAETLLVNMNGQDGLFHNLRSASAFDLNVAGNNFRFFMTGFANSLKTFDECMGLGAPAPQQEAAVAVPQDVQDDLQNPVPPVESAQATSENVIADNSISPALQEIVRKDAAPVQVQEDIVAEIVEVETDIQPENLNENTAALSPAPQEQENQLQTQEDLIEDLTDFVSEPTPLVAEGAAPQDADAMNVAALQARRADNLAPISSEQDAAPVMPMPGEGAALEDEPSVTVAATEEPAALETAPHEGVQDEQKKVSLKDRLQGKKEAELPIADTAPEEEAVKTQMSSPEMKINKQVTSADFDLTDAREVHPAPAVPPSFDNADTAELRKQVALLQGENEALNTELKLALRAGEKERLDVSSKNWNLETATMRYNEAERQVASLGQQIQKERAQCSFEKKELETMLFDPQVTNEAQLAHLAKLEQQLQAARAEIDALRTARGQ